jgi:hypothetical protein
MPDEEESLALVHIDLPNHWAIDGESLWALELGEDLYEIRNSPFHAYAINWGDIVRAPADNEDRIPEVREVVKPSGHGTFRILFNSELDQEGQDSILSALQSLDLSWERCDETFVALDVQPGADLAAVHSKLLDLQQKEVLSFETCEARLPGGFDAAPSEE